MVNPNILSQRYATPEINQIFSEKGKILLERQLWLSILKAQKKLGYSIPEEAIKKYEKALPNIDLNKIKEIEMQTKHDVKAKIEAYNQAAGEIEYIHMGMTSRDLTENVEQLQIKKASEIIFGKYISILRHLTDKAQEYRSIQLVARTHHQAAQPTLLGRRFAMWAEEIHIHLKEYENFIQNYPLRGIKGPVGTQFDMTNLLGSTEKAEQLEKNVADDLGFKTILKATGQVYPRSLDYKLTAHLSSLSSACENFALTMRLMAGYELVTEGFQQGQVGSSVMPHKMNTRSCERICALAELQKMYSDGTSRLMGDQWEEGDVSCSAIRRVIIPDAFYTADGIAETTLTVINNMGPYPQVIEAELTKYMPFLATTAILNHALKQGIGREQAHSIIKKHAIAEALKMRNKGIHQNNLAENLANDPIFIENGITLQNIDIIIDKRSNYIGNAQKQIDEIIENTKQTIIKYTRQASYEPKEIL